MKELSRDFTGKYEKVKLTTGEEIIVSVPKVGWYYDFLIPRFQFYSLQQLDEKVRQEIIKDIQKGQLPTNIIGNLPKGLLNLLLDIVAWYCIEDPKKWQVDIDAKCEWVKENLEITDMFGILNALLRIEDYQRVLDFFGQMRRLQSGSAISPKEIKLKEA